MEIDWLILSEYAEVVGGKLYMLGGGWSRIYATDEKETRKRLSLVMAVNVPFSDLHERHSFEVEFVDGDGHPVGEKIHGTFEAAATVGTPRHMEQRALFVMNVNLKLPGVGMYEVIARIPGAEDKRVPFHVMINQPVAS